MAGFALESQCSLHHHIPQTMKLEPKPIEPPETANLSSGIGHSDEGLKEGLHFCFPWSFCGPVEHTGLKDAPERCLQHHGHILQEALFPPCPPPFLGSETRLKGGWNPWPEESEGHVDLVAE